jgi:hypothetical protein
MLRKFTLVAMAIVSFAIAHAGQAALGWTLAECQRNYRSEGVYQGKQWGLDSYVFDMDGFVKISVLFKDGKVISVTYAGFGSELNETMVQNLLEQNAPIAIWHNYGLQKDQTTQYVGMTGDEMRYYAILSEAVFLGMPLKQLQISRIELSDVIEEQLKSEKL